MGKMRLASIFGIIGIVTMLTASFPVNQIKADDCTKQCESGKKETPCPHVSNRESQNAVGNQASNCEGHLTQVSIPAPVNQLGRSEKPDIEQIYSRDFPWAMLSIDNAAMAAESGNKTIAIVELLKARKILISANDLLGEHLKPQFANTHCPIMGSFIDVDAVDKSLTRDYKGWKIAFCCGGCPLAWDRLTDGQKQYRVPGIKF